MFNHTILSSFLRGLGASLFVVMPISALSAETATLERVYVSAARSETAVLPVATQVKIISEEEIRQSGAKLLTEILRTQAGIQLADMDGSGMRSVTITMRGLAGANNVLVLVDGRKLNNPSQVPAALNNIALRDIERIEILQGSAGVLYGDQAIGGVINIITRRARTGETRGSVSARRGSDNLEDYGVNLSQGFHQGLSYSLSGQKRNADNYRDNNQSAYESLLLNLRYDHERGYLVAEGHSVKDDLRTPGSITDDQAALDRRQTNTPNDFSNVDTDSWRLGAGVNLTRAWSLQVDYSDRNEESDYLLYDNHTQASLRVKSLTPRLVGEYALANGPFVVTVGMDRIDSDYEGNNVWVPVVSSQEQRSYYAQLVYPLLPALTATLGVRQAEVTDDNILQAKKQSDDVTASELGFNYQFNNGWRLFSRFAESFRFANPDDNNLTLPSVDFLRPQTGESVEIGAQWQGERAQVSYSLFRMTLNDEIVLDPITYSNINLPDSKRTGLTLDLDARLSEELALRVNYSYTDAEVIDGIYKGKQVPFIAENAAGVTLLFTPLSPLTFSWEAIYTGTRYRSEDGSNMVAKLPALTVFNLAAVYYLGDLEFTGRINNLTNELYAGYHSLWGQYPQPERNYEAGISYRF